MQSVEVAVVGVVPLERTRRIAGRAAGVPELPTRLLSST